MREALFALAALSILAGITGQATANSIVALDASGQGWIKQDGTSNGTQQGNNYLVGNCGPSDCTPGGEYRDFFQFAVPMFTDTIESARLILQTAQVTATQNPMMDLTLTSTSALTFAQLGSGNVYATRTYSASDASTVIPIDLDVAALTDIAADAGTTLTISGRITSGAVFGPELPSEFVFGRSGPTNPPYIGRLEITVVPECGTLLLVGLGFVSLALIRVRSSQLV